MYSKVALVSFLFIIFTCLVYADDEAPPTLLGAAVMLQPAYDGSRSTNLEVIPVLMYTHGPWFARTTEGILEGGVETELSSGLHFGLQAGYEAGRNRSDSDFLEQHRVVNLYPSLSAGAFLQYEKDIGPVPLDIVARYRKDVDSARGDQIDLRITAGIYGGEGKKFNAEIFAQTTWANNKAMQSYYGLTNTQAANTGLAAFNPGSGNVSNQAGFWCSYDLSSNWIVLANVERHQVAGDARFSPLTEVRYNNYYSLGAAYHF